MSCFRRRKPAWSLRTLLESISNDRIGPRANEAEEHSGGKVKSNKVREIRYVPR